MKKSRLAQLRSDTTVMFGCVAVSTLIAGSLAIQAISASHAAQEQQAQAQQAKAEQARKDREAQVQMKATIKAWEQWRDYIEPQCENVLPRLERSKSYRHYRIHDSRTPVYEGLVVCDRNTVGILKGAMLKPAYLVPRAGSPYPMPSDLPPPEFAPSTP